MFLEIKKGEKLFPLELGQLYMLGKQIIDDKRKSNNFIGLNEVDVCQKHCVIETNYKGEAFVFDLFSFAGTLLNNNNLISLEKTLLKNGDILKLGRQEIKYIHCGHELSRDSSGFLDINKNTSDILASSPDSTSKLGSHASRSGDENFLMPTRPSTSLSSSRRSDSFTIPETQYCRPRSSLNATNISLAESNPDTSEGNIKFNFGNLNSLDDDELCIPETQEVLPKSGNLASQKPQLLCAVQYKANISSLNEEYSQLDSTAGSQFRINTQDYNEGFGEEEVGLHSQVIPVIRHEAVVLNTETNMSNVNEKSIDHDEKEMSALKWTNSKIVQETTEIRADCLTPDIFDFEAGNQETEIVKVVENCENLSTNQQLSLRDVDQEDILSTQILPPVLKKSEEKKSLYDLEKPCLERENEDILTLSDKENRYPVIIETATDLLPTQLFDANAARSYSTTHCNSISSDAKIYSTSKLEDRKNSPKIKLHIEPDPEDDLLTQAFLEPSSVSLCSKSSSSKNMLLEEKLTKKNSANFFAEMEKTPLKNKPISSAQIFKKPEKDSSFLKKTSSNLSTMSENDIDLLMCTPQIIKDNISLEKTEDLRKNILAAKNSNLFGDDTEDDDEDDQDHLVKLINIPKESLDFDKLLPHLKKKFECTNVNKEHDAKLDEQKMYKFNISFGREHDEKQSKFPRTKSSAFSRDERHAARDKEKEILQREPPTKAKNNYKELSKLQEKKLKSKEKEIEKKEKEKQRKMEIERKEKEKERKVKEKDVKKGTSTKDITNNNKKTNSQMEKQAQPLISAANKEEIVGKTQRKNSRLRKGHVTEKIENKQESKAENKVQMTARRMTRLTSRLEETSTTSKNESKEDSIDFTTQSTVTSTRSRSKSSQNDSQDSLKSNSSTNKTNLHKSKAHHNVSPNANSMTKIPERKRKADLLPAAVPTKVDSKRLRSMPSQESLETPTTTVSISVTMVDQELIRNLQNNSKGLWIIAKNITECDILVMDKAFRTFKFLLAIARGIPIVTSEYLKKLNKCNSARQVQLSEYHFVDAEFEKKYKFSLLKSLQAAKNHKLFKGYEFLMTSNILPPPQEIKTIIEISGGYVHEKTLPPPKENQKLYLVTSKEDKKNWHKYRRLNKDIIFVPTEAIMSAVMSQSPQRMKSFILA